MKHLSLLIISIAIGNISYGQQRILRGPLWSFHSKNTDILGISVGILPKEIFKDSTLTRTFGLRLEAPGLGVLLPLVPKSMVSETVDSYSKKIRATPSEFIYGLNLSTGAVGNVEVYGLNLAIIGQYNLKTHGLSCSTFATLSEKTNGISMSILGNESFVCNGMQIAALGNYSTVANGLQVGIINGALHMHGVQVGVLNNFKINATHLQGLQLGLLNKTANLKGIQIGLWNKNNKRSLPFINWNF